MSALTNARWFPKTGPMFLLKELLGNFPHRQRVIWAVGYMGSMEARIELTLRIFAFIRTGSSTRRTIPARSRSLSLNIREVSV